MYLDDLTNHYDNNYRDDIRYRRGSPDIYYSKFVDRYTDYPDYVNIPLYRNDDSNDIELFDPADEILTPVS